MAERIRFETGILSVSPPWLRRLVGAKVLGAFGAQIDDLVDRLVLGVKLRFPGYNPDTIDPSALAAIGRERRILRGPNESDESYAARLLTWWDAHRGRGGPYALLEQLRAYFQDSQIVHLVTDEGERIVTDDGEPLVTDGYFTEANFRIDVVYQSGTRRWVAPDGTITRDAIVWNGDGSGQWAHIWVFFYLDRFPGGYLITDDGYYIVTDNGERIAVDGISDDVAEVFLAVAREWSAAHIPYVTVVLLWDSTELWDYPQPVGAWDEPSGATWSASGPVILTAQ